MIKSVLSLVLMLIVSSVAMAAEKPKAGAEGEGYELVTPPHPTNDPSKIEVMEFFWYGCPHCMHFEPHVKAWLKTKPANVVFIRQPAIFNPRWGAHAKAFFTAETLGVLDKVHDDFYDAIQNKKEALESEADLAKFFLAHGVKEDDFHKAYKSFAVDAKMRQAEGLAPSFGIDGTPALVINGKYRVGAATAKSFEKMIEVTNALIKQESAASAGK
ncbi:MAG: thiol:disulfide interchange protein DsbA/DsbL [Methylococcaceae bacterium]|nr:thiol:disulfide interchange protein DsbA/DsbL [Methylococcaceae bacterium]